MEGLDGRAYREINEKLLAKKKDVTSEKNIKKICSLNRLKSLTNLSKKLSMDD